jgi:HEAT repeat protein
MMSSMDKKRTPRWTALLLVALGAAMAAATDEPADPAADPYVVTINVRPWIEALRSDDLFQVDPAIESLSALGEHGLPALQAALRNEGRLAKVNIVEVLRDIHTPATVPLLIEAAADQDEEVRHDAIEALGRVGDPRGRPALEAALSDPAASVQRAAVRGCLSLCTSPQALRRLVEKSLEKRTSANARTSLGRVATDQKIHAQIRTLSDEIAVPVMNDTGSPNRFNAALMVADSGNPAALPVLRECVDRQTQPLLAVMCVQALGSLATDPAIAILAEVARTGSEGLVRPAACKVLTRLARSNPAAHDAKQACVGSQESGVGSGDLE